MSPYLLSALANLLTFVRLPMAGAIWIAPGDDQFVIWMMVAAAVTDILDGSIARLAQAVALAQGKGDLDRARRIGAWLDPFCDKTFVLSVLAAVYVTDPASLPLLIMTGAREFILVPATGLWRMVAIPYDRRHVFFAAGPLGKATTVMQFLAIGSIVLEFPSGVRLGAAALAGGLGILAAIHYIARARRAIQAARSRQ